MPPAARGGSWDPPRSGSRSRSRQTLRHPSSPSRSVSYPMRRRRRSLRSESSPCPAAAEPTAPPVSSDATPVHAPQAEAVVEEAGPVIPQHFVGLPDLGQSAPALGLDVALRLEAAPAARGVARVPPPRCRRRLRRRRRRPRSDLVRVEIPAPSPVGPIEVGRRRVGGDPQRVVKGRLVRGVARGVVPPVRPEGRRRGGAALPRRSARRRRQAAAPGGGRGKRAGPGQEATGAGGGGGRWGSASSAFRPRSPWSWLSSSSRVIELL